MPTLQVPADHDWTPERIRNLREHLGWTQTEFGQYVYDYSAANAQTYVSRLESGDRKPGAAARKTLQRLEEQAENQKQGA